MAEIFDPVAELPTPVAIKQPDVASTFEEPQPMTSVDTAAPEPAVQPPQDIETPPAEVVMPKGLAGYLDWAGANDVDGFAAVSGWVSSSPGVRVWVETATGQQHDLGRALRYVRPDLVKSDHESLGRVRGASAAFLIGIPGVAPGQYLRLMAEFGGRVVQLGDRQITALPTDPFAAFKVLAGISTGQHAKRFGLADLQVLQPLIDRQAAWTLGLPVDAVDLGDLPENPLVSLIIPLYKRFDFVEPQLMKFSQDPWLMAHAEIIYVVDDPELIDTMRQQAPALHSLYGVPFRWVWGHANRGFSGANNLGVSVSKADTLLFVNSDVFPMSPGWARTLKQVLDDHPEVGAVGPRLLHSDGSVQHAGMSFEYSREFGIWTNIHPGKGLPGALVPGKGLEEVPAVTGACMAVRRTDLARVGGWSTGYLIGDFEDSDLCMALRELGLCIACEHDVELVHLERQSFRQLGDDGFRTQIVILNAVRHQQRWTGSMEVLIKRPMYAAALKGAV